MSGLVECEKLGVISDYKKDCGKENSVLYKIYPGNRHVPLWFCTLYRKNKSFKIVKAKINNFCETEGIIPLEAFQIISYFFINRSFNLELNNANSVLD